MNVPKILRYSTKSIDIFYILVNRVNNSKKSSDQQVTFDFLRSLALAAGRMAP